MFLSCMEIIEWRGEEVFYIYMERLKCAVQTIRFRAGVHFVEYQYTPFTCMYMYVCIFIQHACARVKQSVCLSIVVSMKIAKSRHLGI